MSKKYKFFLSAMVAFLMVSAALPAFAQEAPAAEAAAEEAPPAEDVQLEGGFVSTVFKNGPINTIVWLMIFATSAATLALIIDALITVKKDKLMPEELVDGVRESLNEGNLDVSIEACESSPCPVANILMVGFANITEGYEVIQEAVASAAEIENEKLLQRVNYLNLCGQIAPMLGLLGTVLGMVKAFETLGSASGAAKAALLAQSIATALWTTAVGLLIAVPALLAYTLVKNYATRILLEVEATVLDLIKVLRNAEVEE